jgi:hypothetical protein
LALRPLHGGSNGNVIGFLCLHEVDELSKERWRLSQFKSQGTAHLNIMPNGFPEGVH